MGGLLGGGMGGGMGGGASNMQGANAAQAAMAAQGGPLAVAQASGLNPRVSPGYAPPPTGGQAYGYGMPGMGAPAMGGMGSGGYNPNAFAPTQAQLLANAPGTAPGLGGYGGPQPQLGGMGGGHGGPTPFAAAYNPWGSTGAAQSAFAQGAGPAVPSQFQAPPPGGIGQSYGSPQGAGGGGGLPPQLMQMLRALLYGQ
jgi:hypothetical protein